MQPDHAIVDLPPHLAARCKTTCVLIEAIEMDGAAILVAVARHWTERDGEHVVPNGAWLDVPHEHRAEFEALFVAARKQQRGPDYHEARHGWRDTKPASRPDRPCAPVRRKPRGVTW